MRFAKGQAMNPVRRILCWFLGHHYHPVYEERWTEGRFRNSRQRQHVRDRFTCWRCGQKTKWMDQKQAREFLETRCRWSDD